MASEPVQYQPAQVNETYVSKNQHVNYRGWYKSLMQARPFN